MTLTTSPSLDLERLENVRNHPGKITARCPACAEEERDRTGNNLVHFDGGAFSCVSDPEHTKRIFELVGIKSEAPRLSREEWIKRKRDDGDRQRRERERHDLAACVRRKRETIVNGWRWNTEDVWEDSPTRPTSAIDDPRIFITSLFDPEAIVWTGETKQSGEHWEERWRTVPECFESPVEEIGPMIAPATWKPGTINRKKENVLTAPFVVLDFDGLPGQTFADDTELARHLSDSRAIVRWLREVLNWNLAAIVWTGSKSLHAWFDDPGAVAVESLRNTAVELGIDVTLIGHPEHPCRLPGQRHATTGGMSRCLWLR